MNKNNLWSLRLGYSSKQANFIEKNGIGKFLEISLNQNIDHTIPDFIKNSPQTLAELKELKQKALSNSVEDKKQIQKQQIETAIEMRAWWIQKIQTENFPLREKMTCFWHNHYVATFQKVKVNNWIYQHNEILRTHAFGNFKELTKKIIQSNAIIKYLDNNDNRRGKLNENLSRELLELFTLGIGNYSEQDIKNGAKGLAGLGFGEDNAIYRKKIEDPENFSYFGKNGNFKINEMIDIIFEQPNIPYLITKKILQWFLYDNPSNELVKYYGNYFRKKNFEIAPLLQKIFTDEFKKNIEGTKIKDPMTFILQILDELNIDEPNPKLIAYFLKSQGMDLFNQPNVKGWDGGTSWLSSQVFLQRQNVSDLLSNGKNITRKRLGTGNDENEMMPNNNQLLNIRLDWNRKSNNKQIIENFKNRLLFETSESSQKDFENILKYDFDGALEGSQNAVFRLFNAMIKTAEFQLV